ncbi:MAG: hypothetical protein IKH13_09835 [Clostridia bacterium]|nr:hypothetical protein [Clostridia bacterium]
MKILKKSTAVLLALLIAFSAMSVAAAAEDGAPAEGREPFIAKEADCRIDLEYKDYVFRSEKVKMTAVGSYIDITETEAAPVEGDVRLVPVKWTAKQDDTVIDNGDWTELRTEQTTVVNTEKVKINDGSDSVEVVVEVEFAKQEYKDGKWETIGEYTGSNKIVVKAETTTSFFSRLIAVLLNPLRSLDWMGGRFGPGVVSKAINDFIEEHWHRGKVVSTSEGDSVVGSVVEALGAIVIMIVEFFEDIFPWSR